ncbi:hypothetical protein [Caenibius sp. WL]|uniref:hypothetical protein n=1 Tax=Caenibius sp. WL TaxID=2872646 RepID=UPI001C99D7C5|nr:hypothetical protein [Caenibius sp. WL]QZP06825.1 hypothetical protein K5X80_08795 [Caenibius sp. WL]
MAIEWSAAALFALVFVGAGVALSIDNLARKNEGAAWHVLRRIGVWLFWIGVAVFALAFFIPDTIPEAPRSSYGESIDLDAYRAQLQTAQNYARISALANWLANKAIAGGFLMWLAGRVIDAFRHPEHY